MNDVTGKLSASVLEKIRTLSELIWTTVLSEEDAGTAVDSTIETEVIGHLPWLFSV